MLNFNRKLSQMVLVLLDSEQASEAQTERYTKYPAVAGREAIWARMLASSFQPRIKRQTSWTYDEKPLADVVGKSNILRCTWVTAHKVMSD